MVPSHLFFCSLLIQLLFLTNAAGTTPSIDWHDCAQQDGAFIRGRGWTGEKELGSIPYVRLPTRASSVVPSAVWSLSRDSAGLHVVFETNATDIWVNLDLRSPTLSMPHMPATGVSGVDLYVKDEHEGGNGGWRFAASSIEYWGPSTQNTSAGHLLSGATPAVQRTMTLYLPLYNGVQLLRVGVNAGASMRFIPEPNVNKPIVFWGTSILQGAVASRPGMAYVNMLRRVVDRPIFDLGFSGHGKMQSTVVPFISEIDAAQYVIQCNPNMDAAEISERTVPVVDYLRKKHPDAPILLVEGHTYTNAWIKPALAEAQALKREALRAAFEALVAKGTTNLSYLRGDYLLCEGNVAVGCDGEATVGGTHPSDLGMRRMSQALKGHLL